MQMESFQTNTIEYYYNDNIRQINIFDKDELKIKDSYYEKKERIRIQDIFPLNIRLALSQENKLESKPHCGLPVIHKFKNLFLKVLTRRKYRTSFKDKCNIKYDFTRIYTIKNDGLPIESFEFEMEYIYDSKKMTLSDTSNYIFGCLMFTLQIVQHTFQIITLPEIVNISLEYSIL